MYMDGMSPKKIAQIHGLESNEVFEILAKAGVKLRKSETSRRKLSDGDVHKIRTTELETQIVDLKSRWKLSEKKLTDTRKQLVEVEKELRKEVAARQKAESQIEDLKKRLRLVNNSRMRG